MNKVACELIDTGVPLSVLPLGTVNNLARSLGFIASLAAQKPEGRESNRIEITVKLSALVILQPRLPERPVA